MLSFSLWYSKRKRLSQGYLGRSEGGMVPTNDDLAPVASSDCGYVHLAMIIDKKVTHVWCRRKDMPLAIVFIGPLQIVLMVSNLVS
jgi:hypothetical protein